MARMELTEDGHLVVDGKAHAASPEGLAALQSRAPEFLDSIRALSMLIDAVDNAEWQQMAREQFVRLLDAMHTEVFEGCCAQCRAIIDATFRFGAPDAGSVS